VPEILDYSPPAPKEGSLPRWALIAGLLSGPVTLGANVLFLAIVRQLDQFAHLSIIAVIQFCALLFALIVRSNSPHFTRGRRLATAGAICAFVWFLCLTWLCCGFFDAMAH
jgi:hypothetical protein